jgi:hypothetical protein
VTTTALAASPNSAALSGSLKLRATEATSELTMRMFLYRSTASITAARSIASRKLRQVMCTDMHETPTCPIELMDQRGIVDRLQGVPDAHRIRSMSSRRRPASATIARRPRP